jgi:hypothetical protein
MEYLQLGLVLVAVAHLLLEMADREEMAASPQAVAVAVEQHAMELLVLVVLVQTESLLLLLIFNMETYALLAKNGGWLENLVVWNGNRSTWTPPSDVIVKLASEVDFLALPLSPKILNDPVEIIIDIEAAGSY